MASQHIKKQLRKLQADPNILDVLSNKLALITSKCYEKLSNVKKKLHPLITSLISELNTDPVEDHVRKARISNIKQQKELLQLKLDQINKSIEQGEIEEHRFKKPNLQFEKIRHEFFKEEQEKSKQNAQKVKEYYSEQLRRQEKIRKHIESLNKDLVEEKAKRSISQRERSEKFEESYTKELEKMQERTRRRKKELEEAEYRRLQYQDLLHEKPLYQKIEERYFDQIEMKEFERRKEELAKKRINFQPLNKSELLEHAKKHDQILKEKEKNSNFSIINESKTYNSKNILEVIKRDNEKKAEEERVLREKLQRIENKKQYGQVVRDLYAPAVDKFKQMELLLRMEKLKNPVVKKKFNFEGSTAAQSDSEIRIPKKKIRNEQEAEVDKGLKNRRANSKVVDYLAVCRARRINGEIDEYLEDSFEDYEENDLRAKAKKLQIKAEKLDKKAKRAELSLHSVNSGIRNIENSEKVDAIIISAIKAKLGALNLANNN